MADGPHWMFNPTSGGTKIPEQLRPTIAARVRRHLEEHFGGRYRTVDVRFRGKFCYVDVYQDPDLPEDWPPPGFGETREQALERLRTTPLRLCRLRFRGSDTWSFDLYSYASERYEPNVFATGDWGGNAGGGRRPGRVAAPGLTCHPRAHRSRPRGRATRQRRRRRCQQAATHSGKQRPGIYAVERCAAPTNDVRNHEAAERRLTGARSSVG
jgi:hypothetical protein